mmetsp:Transcript_25684/g.48274  ORF Transcript_25684/g.48274 Transcript_25684/m.48274 type:complete len:206 (-) Transcript_25684:355-972(-)
MYKTWKPSLLSPSNFLIKVLDAPSPRPSSAALSFSSEASISLHFKCSRKPSSILALLPPAILQNLLSSLSLHIGNIGPTCPTSSSSVALSASTKLRRWENELRKLGLRVFLRVGVESIVLMRGRLELGLEEGVEGWSKSNSLSGGGPGDRRQHANIEVGESLLLGFDPTSAVGGGGEIGGIAAGDKGGDSSVISSSSSSSHDRSW